METAEFEEHVLAWPWHRKLAMRLRKSRMLFTAALRALFVGCLLVAAGAQGQQAAYYPAPASTSVNGTDIGPSSVTTASVDAGVVLAPTVAAATVDAGVVIATTEMRSNGLANFTGVLNTGTAAGAAIGVIPSTTRGAVCLNQAAPSSANCTLYDLSATTILNSTAGVALDINGVTKAQVDATGKFTIGASGTGVSNWIEGTGTLDFASASTGACSADLTITVTGAVAGDECSVGVLNASVPAGSIFWCWISATNTASVRHCCHTGAAACDPASGVFRARVTNH